MITKELINSIMAKANDADSIYTELKKVESIRASIKSLSSEIEVEHKRHQEKKREIESELKKVRELCQHWTQTYHTDPSGNNDSYSECNICGKYL